MSFKPKSEILSIHHWADVMTAIIRNQLHNALPHASNEGINSAWPFRVSIRWLQLRIDDEFSAMMKWSKRSTNADTYLVKELERSIELLTNEKFDDRNEINSEVLDLIYQEVDVVNCLLIQKCNEVISPNPWFVWTIKTNNDVVLLESDYDYRIKIVEDLYKLTNAESMDDMSDKIITALANSNK